MRAKYLIMLVNYDCFYCDELTDIDDVLFVIDIYKKKISFNLIDWEKIGWRG